MSNTSLKWKTDDAVGLIQKIENFRNNISSLSNKKKGI